MTTHTPRNFQLSIMLFFTLMMQTYIMCGRVILRLTHYCVKIRAENFSLPYSLHTQYLGLVQSSWYHNLNYDDITEYSEERTLDPLVTAKS